MIALLMLSVWVLLVACALALFSGAKCNHCTGSCQQGRNCTCGDRDA